MSPIEQQLDILAQLPANWDGDGSDSVNSKALAIVRQMLTTAPVIGPARDGSIDLMWMWGGKPYILINVDEENSKTTIEGFVYETTPSEKDS